MTAPRYGGDYLPGAAPEYHHHPGLEHELSVLRAELTYVRNQGIALEKSVAKLTREVRHLAAAAGRRP